MFPKAYHPTEIAGETFEVALYKQLVFAIKYEGINLLVFSQLAKWLNKEQVEKLVAIEPTGQYSRKIWFILEWITGEKTETAPDLSKRSYVKLVDETLQYSVEGEKSPRHMIINKMCIRDRCTVIFLYLRSLSLLYKPAPLNHFSSIELRCV